MSGSEINPEKAYFLVGKRIARRMSHREPKSSEAGDFDSCVELGKGGMDATLTLRAPHGLER